MGGQNSVPGTPGGGSAKGGALDWGLPPEDIPEDERDGEELVLQTWAFCKAKPSPAHYYRSDVEERKRRQSILWRKRASFIELDCGEDSFFVSNTYKTIGVADGVGGWREEGVDPAHFANSLMENAKHFSETHRKELNPEVILQSAFEKVIADGKVKAGSSTACVVSLQKDDSGGHFLDVANVGDSGVLVVRNREVHHRVHEKVHAFNAPFQLAILPTHLKGRAFADRVSDATREKVPVQKGDVVITATDGLFDNRFNISLAADAGWIGHVEGSVLERVPLVGMILGPIFANDKVAYVDPQRVAQRIVQEAYKVSLDESANTPWSSMLKKFGAENAKGGKVDDITIVLSRVTTREELSATSTW
uniref:Protein phosphatase n=1 Tax=Trypanosoma congolense (strain IL3000) TaxID=1068625 RepID=G0UJZ5_TRYCI|nr:unnamed protein product [Trypanosoma congolense IL3000]